MNPRIVALLGLALVGLTGCVTPYQHLGPTGGYTDQDLGQNVVRVRFTGNGGTTRETAQSYWLWRCMEITLDRGFDGFEILSNMSLSSVPHLQPIPPMSEPSLRAVAYAPIVVAVPIVIDLPQYTGDIHLLKGPITIAPPKVFDARKLKEFLGPFVLPAARDRQNVKPHIHEYLLPPGKLTPPN